MRNKMVWIAAASLPMLTACEFTVKNGDGDQNQTEANSSTSTLQPGQQSAPQQAQVDPQLQNLRFQVDINPEWIPPKDEEWAEDRDPKKPGAADNPLGRVRLVYRMPNTIHGTYDKESLGTATSHGSIRIDNEVGLQLAQMLLKAGGSWQGDPWFQQMLANKTKEFEIKLRKPIPIAVQD